MKRICAALIFIVQGVLAGQVPTAPSPALPEIGRLEYFIGTWHVETTTPPASDPPSVSVQEYERLEGTAFVVLRSRKASPPEVQLAVFGFDPAKRVYSADYFTAPNLRLSMSGMASGENWTWISRDGQFRQTMRVVSPSTFTFQFARSRGTTGWLSMAEGKAVRIEEPRAQP